MVEKWRSGRGSCGFVVQHGALWGLCMVWRTRVNACERVLRPCVGSNELLYVLRVVGVVGVGSGRSLGSMDGDGDRVYVPASSKL